MSINYSIIIPHKNSANLLQYCLDSIPVRDDVQVIVVDDNSDADKVDFAHFPQWKGKYYETYFTKEGRGAGYARNVALKHVLGKWLIIIGADDYLTEHANRIFDENINCDADIIFFRPNAVMISDRKTFSHRADPFNAIIDDYLISGDETDLRVKFSSDICKFIRFDLISKYAIRFDEVKYANDVFFSAQVGCNAQKIKVRDCYFYTITQGTTSLTSNYCKKPGEVQIRAREFFKVQEYITKFGFVIDEPQSCEFLSAIITLDKLLFISYLRFFFEHTNHHLIPLLFNIFQSNSFIPKIKRVAYALFLFLFCKKIDNIL